MTPNEKMIGIAETAADQAAQKSGSARGSEVWQVAREAALNAIISTVCELTKLATEANISVPLAPGMPDGAAIARRSIIDSIDTFAASAAKPDNGN